MTCTGFSEKGKAGGRRDTRSRSARTRATVLAFPIAGTQQSHGKMVPVPNTENALTRMDCAWPWSSSWCKDGRGPERSPPSLHSGSWSGPDLSQVQMKSTHLVPVERKLAERGWASPEHLPNILLAGVCHHSPQQPREGHKMGTKAREALLFMLQV